jgi:Bacterial Ig-like domain (group 3)
MSKLIRRIPGRKKEIGAALIVALQLISVTLIGLMLPFGSGPQPVTAPTDSQMSAAQSQTQTDQAATVQPLTPAEKSALRKSAVFAKKLQEPLASQVFNLATSRAESARQSGQQSSQQSMQQGEAPSGATLTTDQEDYPPFSYVYISGTGFEPGETVNMIVVELDPTQQSFEPWDVVADDNGNIETSWYIFSEEFIGATMQVTATGQTSGLTASAIFTDARNWVLTFAGTGTGTVTITPDSGFVNAPPSCGGTGTNAASQTVFSTCLPNITTTVNGAVITFTASADPGSTFGGWSAVTNFSPTTCSGTTNPCTGVAGGGALMTVTFNGPTPTPTATATATAAATATATPTATFTPTPTPAATNLTVAAASGTYGGSVNLTATLTSGSGISGESISFTIDGNPVGSATTNGSGVATVTVSPLCGSAYNAGGHTIGATFAGDTNYAAASGSNSLTVAKANAAVTVTPYTVTYDGNPHTATVASIVGVCGEIDATVGTVDVSGTTHTNADTYNDTWSFTGTGNYNDIVATAITDTINKADAIIDVTPYDVTYDCAAHSATGTATGANSEDLSSLFDFSGTSHTNAGDYPSDSWTFNNGNTNPNYNSASGTLHDSIAKADASITVTPYSVTYNCAAHMATGTATGCDGDLSSLLDLSGTSHMNAGDYPTDAWSFAGNANYNAASGTVHDSIAKADATINVTPYHVTYNCNVHMATGTATGCDGDLSSLLDFSGTSHTSADDYPSDSWTFNNGNTNPNYNSASGMLHDQIDKAHATINVTPYNVAYDTQPHTATGTASGCDGDLSSLLNLSGTTHTNPGDYTSDSWTFNSANTNTNYFSESGTVHDIIHYGVCAGSEPGGVILPPINTDGSSVYKRKAGSTIPVKFKVCDANGNSISDPNLVFQTGCCGSITLVSAVRGTVDNVNEMGINDIPDVAFRWTGDKWIFNMATTSVQAGYTYTFRINLLYGNIMFTIAMR